MEIHLHIIGFLLLALAMIHVAFPTYFNWDKELKSLSLINRQMTMVHTFFIALTVFMMGLLCLTSAHDLMTTYLGKKISLGLGVFWIVRLLIQFFGYSTQLWKGKKMETVIHILFSAVWIYFSIIFLSIYFR